MGRIRSSRRPPPPSLSQGAAPTSSARTVQAASRSSAKLGSIVIRLGAPSALCANGRSAAPWLGPRRRRRLREPQRSLCSRCSRLPPPRKLTELERGGGAGSRESQLIPPTRLATRERPLAEPRGAAPVRNGRRPGPGAHRCGVRGTSAGLWNPRSPWTPETKGGLIWLRERDRQWRGR